MQRSQNEHHSIRLQIEKRNDQQKKFNSKQNPNLRWVLHLFAGLRFSLVWAVFLEFVGWKNLCNTNKHWSDTSFILSHIHLLVMSSSLFYMFICCATCAVARCCCISWCIFPSFTFTLGFYLFVFMSHHILIFFKQGSNGVSFCKGCHVSVQRGSTHGLRFSNGASMQILVKALNHKDSKVTLIPTYIVTGLHGRHDRVYSMPFVQQNTAWP